jgi:hypothetical protein
MNLENKIILLVIIVATVSIGAYTFHTATASHSFEQGAAAGTLPVATTIILAGQVLQPGDYIPLVDFSPNFVAGHLLVRIPCDSNANPLVIPIAGHIDELPERTFMEQAQMNYIAHASNPGKTCVYHSHVPAADVDAIGFVGAPRITDIGLINLSDKNVVFRTGNAMSFTIHNVLGDINPPNNYGPHGTSMPKPYNGMPPEYYPHFPSGFSGADHHDHNG